MCCPTSPTPSCSAQTPSPTSCGGSWSTWARRPTTADTGEGNQLTRKYKMKFWKISDCGLDIRVSARFPWYSSWEIYRQLWLCWCSGLFTGHKSMIYPFYHTYNCLLIFVWVFVGVCWFFRLELDFQSIRTSLRYKNLELIRDGKLKRIPIWNPGLGTPFRPKAT